MCNITKLDKRARNIYTLSLVLTLLGGYALGFLNGWNLRPITYNLDIDQAATTSQGQYNFEVIIIQGGHILNIFGHNTYSTIGKRFERNLKGFHNVTQNATSGYLGYVSLSNDASPAATWTQLAGEASTMGATRKAFDTLTVINSTSINGTVTFTFTGSITLQCAGIQWDSHSLYNNNLYAAFAFTSTAFAASDVLIIKYYNQEAGT